MKRIVILASLLAPICLLSNAQEKGKPEDTEYYSPVPVVVTPGVKPGDCPV
jgi:hypothetical protein